MSTDARAFLRHINNDAWGRLASIMRGDGARQTQHSTRRKSSLGKVGTVHGPLLCEANLNERFMRTLKAALAIFLDF